jgi:hypothetical protein
MCLLICIISAAPALKNTADSPKATDSALSIVFYFRTRARVRSYRVKLFPLLNILFLFRQLSSDKSNK